GIMAHKIQVATGVSAWCYLKGRNTPLRFDGSEPYTRSDFDYWLMAHTDSDDISIEKFSSLASDTFLLMLKAAKQCGRPKNHLPALEMAFQFWCAEMIKNFQ